MHACMHAYMHACVHAYMHACIYTCMHACMGICMHGPLEMLAPFSSPAAASGGPDPGAISRTLDLCSCFMLHAVYTQASRPVGPNGVGANMNGYMYFIYLSARARARARVCVCVCACVVRHVCERRQQKYRRVCGDQSSEAPAPLLRGAPIRGQTRASRAESACQALPTRPWMLAVGTCLRRPQPPHRGAPIRGQTRVQGAVRQ